MSQKVRLMIFFVIFITNAISAQNLNNCVLNVQCSCVINDADDVTCTDLNTTRSKLEVFLAQRSKLYTSMVITDKNIPILTDNLFVNFSITTVDLSYNQIESISINAFKGMTFLSTLSLAYNNIKSLDDLISSITMSDLSSLKALELEYNLIDELATSFTKAFSNLRALNLEGNYLKSVGSSVFKSISNFTSLSLVNNKLTSLEHVYLSSFTYITEVVLDWNNINKFKTENTTINIERLIMFNLGLSYLEPFSFRSFKYLDYLDLRANNLRVLETNTFRCLFDLQNLNLISNKIEVIKDGAFVGLVKLKKLSLRNNQLKSISKMTFQNLGNLQTLVFNDNRINSIEDFAFRELVSLTSLYLSYNKLVNITNRTFAGLKNLYFVDLTANPVIRIDSYSFCDFRLSTLNPMTLKQLKVEYLPDELFGGLAWIGEIDLSNNQIKQLKKRTFLNLTSTKKLDLSSNMISSIEDGAFEDMSYLDYLTLTYNLLTNVNERTFNGLVSLTELYLSHNTIKSIAPRTFSKLTLLSVLYLDSNTIFEIEWGTFHSLQSLAELVLSENKIEQIKNNHFRTLPALRKLHLEQNKIISIQANSFANLSNLNEILIGSNPIGEFKTGAFNGIVKSTTLRLSSSDIEILPSNYFNNLQIRNLLIARSKVKVLQDFLFVNCSAIGLLDLNYNQISFVSNRFYWFNISNPLRANTQLESLLLANNKIASLNFTDNQFLRSLTELELSGNLIEVVQASNLRYLTKLSTLSLINNKIKFFEPKSLQNSLKGVYLSNLVLEPANVTFDLTWFPSSTVNLDLSFGNFRSIKFKSMNQLKNLWLRNLNIEHLKDTKLSLFFSKVEALDLSQNRLGAINSSFFSGLPFLVKLNMSHTGIRNLDAVSVKTLWILDASFNLIEYVYKNQLRSQLSQLYLQNNRIKFVESDFFRGRFQLKEIDLRNNLLDYISLDDLFSQTSLNIALISNNSIRTVEPLIHRPVFVSLRMLDLSFNQISELNLNNVASDNEDDDYNFPKINLSNNRLKHIDQSLFNSFRKLLDLNLVSNEIAWIEPHSFYDLSLLIDLNISSNKLASLDVASFSGLTLLATLNLSFNSIEIIQKGLFSDLLKLVQLDLRENKLKFIENYAFQNLVSLKYLNLNSNPNLSISNASLNGLKLIQEIFISFSLLNNKNESIEFIKLSLKPFIYKRNYDYVYYKSINVMYEEQVVDCEATLNLIKANIHLNLKTSSDYNSFWSDCHTFDLSLQIMC
jgi:Leucine-rich repeat (LRR) protein